MDFLIFLSIFSYLFLAICVHLNFDILPKTKQDYHKVKFIKIHLSVYLHIDLQYGICSIFIYRNS